MRRSGQPGETSSSDHAQEPRVELSQRTLHRAHVSHRKMTIHLLLSTLVDCVGAIRLGHQSGGDSGAS